MAFLDKFKILKSKSSIDKEIEEYQRMMLYKGIYSLTNSKEFKDYIKTCPADKKKRLFEMYSSWDMVNPMDISNGNYIERIISNPNYYVGTHRSSMIDGYNLLEDDTLDKIFDKGLIVLGDASSGSIRYDAGPNKTLSFFGNSLLPAMINIKGKYKGSTSVIFSMIPKKYVTKDGDIIPGMEHMVYDYDDIGQPYVKPELLVGVMTQTHSEELCKFIPKELLMEQKNGRGI